MFIERQPTKLSANTNCVERRGEEKRRREETKEERRKKRDEKGTFASEKVSRTHN